MNNCIDCNKKLSRNDHKRCRDCYLKWLSIPKNNPNYGHLERFIGKNNSNFKNGKPHCEDCGKILINYNAKFCRKHFQLNDKNPNWKNGISELPYSFDFRLISKKIIEKYNNICQLCFEKGIVTHHIDYNKMNNKNKNLICLCRKCNTKVNFNRDYWYAYFTYLRKE